MGLDMNMIGKRKFRGRKDLTSADARISTLSEEIWLGYWRKHHNLNEYIGNEFNKGNYDGQGEIPLTEENLNKILSAIKAGDIPPYFPEIDAEEQKKKDIAIIQQTIDWLKTEDQECTRTAYYEYCN